RDVLRHWLTCVAMMGMPRTIKMDNGPAYVSHKVGDFCSHWGITHITGVPSSPMGQAIVERTHWT
ncbi:POK18 protein, partial [Halcyon senegalensis]|nr:POK18 protein [Halcyon senegalensis]